ncbi:Sigma-70 family RNA polymerase sigma factor [Sulfidibacter corallicola]|uniref:Sigma-70 family RNA polymerase sigma factor n=1 Tax=Sulfidibacter corallicola TaxID=2818388 RepID=A0A8A4TPI1_SULCO|nr:ECF-type sigma factor [Sulfidibacter corallicola]QTD50878.1 sigma-70 family RNA polymerase sigma factor [Sulfidibacter corallicola]
MSTGKRYKSAKHDRVTDYLESWERGDPEGLERLMELVYGELCVIARGHLNRERQNHPFNTETLVNEMYLRMFQQKRHRFENRIHFFGIAARLMRQILVDYARSNNAFKRRLNHSALTEKLDIEMVEELTSDRAVELMKLDEALKVLMRMDANKARIVELRYFAGFTIEEAAEALGVSPATVKREWTFTKAWLQRYISHG